MPEDRKPNPNPEPYRFENGDLYIPPQKPAKPFIPDRGFDEPSACGDSQEIRP